MKKIIIGMSALMLVTSTIVFANNTETKKTTVSCSNGCPKTTNCTAGTTCAIMPGCVCK